MPLFCKVASTLLVGPGRGPEPVFMGPLVTESAADAKLAVELAKDNAAALARIEAAIAAGPVPAPVDGTLSGDVTFTPKT